jgi:hypothetical protein
VEFWPPMYPDLNPLGVENRDVLKTWRQFISPIKLAETRGSSPENRWLKLRTT